MSYTIFYDKDVEKYKQKLKYYKLTSIQKKYFLICEDCFWMASTLPHPLDYPLLRYKKCPICKNNVDNFTIPKLYFQINYGLKDEFHK